MWVSNRWLNCRTQIVGALVSGGVAVLVVAQVSDEVGKNEGSFPEICLHSYDIVSLCFSFFFCSSSSLPMYYYFISIFLSFKVLTDSFDFTFMFSHHDYIRLKIFLIQLFLCLIILISH